MAAGHGLYALLLADRARCLAELGRHDDAAIALKQQEHLLPGKLTPDDLALCHASFEACAQILGDEASSEAHRTAKSKALGEHKLVMRNLLEKILKYSDQSIINTRT